MQPNQSALDDARKRLHQAWSSYNDVCGQQQQPQKANQHLCRSFVNMPYGTDTYKACAHLRRWCPLIDPFWSCSAGAHCGLLACALLSASPASRSSACSGGRGSSGSSSSAVSSASFTAHLTPQQLALLRGGGSGGSSRSSGQGQAQLQLICVLIGDKVAAGRCHWPRRVDVTVNGHSISGQVYGAKRLHSSAGGLGDHQVGLIAVWSWF